MNPKSTTKNTQPSSSRRNTENMGITKVKILSTQNSKERGERQKNNLIPKQMQTMGVMTLKKQRKTKQLFQTRNTTREIKPPVTQVPELRGNTQTITERNNKNMRQNSLIAPMSPPKHDDSQPNKSQGMDINSLQDSYQLLQSFNHIDSSQHNPNTSFDLNLSNFTSMAKNKPGTTQNTANKGIVHKRMETRDINFQHASGLQHSDQPSTQVKFNNNFIVSRQRNAFSPDTKMIGVNYFLNNEDLGPHLNNNLQANNMSVRLPKIKQSNTPFPNRNETVHHLP
jgi:hypothetical protein